MSIIQIIGLLMIKLSCIDSSTHYVYLPAWYRLQHQLLYGFTTTKLENQVARQIHSTGTVYTLRSVKIEHGAWFPQMYTRHDPILLYKRKFTQSVIHEATKKELLWQTYNSDPPPYLYYPRHKDYNFQLELKLNYADLRRFNMTKYIIKVGEIEFLNILKITVDLKSDELRDPLAIFAEAAYQRKRTSFIQSNLHFAPNPCSTKFQRCDKVANVYQFKTSVHHSYALTDPRCIIREPGLFEGQYSCICKAGYRFDDAAKTCELIDLCEEDHQMALDNQTVDADRLCSPQGTLMCISLSDQAEKAAFRIRMGLSSTEVMLPYQCICKPGYSGYRCERRLDACTEVSQDFPNPGNRACQVHKGNVCRSQNGTGVYSCTCNKPWRHDLSKSYPNCYARDLLCDKVLCRNGAKCVSSPDQKIYACICRSLWRGRHCEIPDLREWLPWGPWSICTAPVCGGQGWQRRDRQCRIEVNKTTGLGKCDGNTFDLQPCYSSAERRSVFKKFKQSLSAFCGLGTKSTLLLQSDSTELAPVAACAKSSIPVWATGGRLQLDMNDFVECVAQANPSAYQLPVDNETGLSETRSRSRKQCLQSVARTHHYSYLIANNAGLEEMLSAFPRWVSIAGGNSLEARIESIKSIDFSSTSIAGLILDGFLPPASDASSSSDDDGDMFSILTSLSSHLPVNLPRFLTGVWQLGDIVRCATKGGIDLFDGTLPYRLTRSAIGWIYADWSPNNDSESSSTLNQTHISFPLPDLLTDSGVHEPLQLGCECFTCRNHTKAYISHMNTGHEMLGPMLLMM